MLKGYKLNTLLKNLSKYWSFVWRASWLDWKLSGTLLHMLHYQSIISYIFFNPFSFNWNVLKIFLKNSYFICDQYWWLKYENNSLLNLWFKAWMLLIFQVELTIVHWVGNSFYLGPLMFCNIILSKISWNYSYACINFLLEEFLLNYIIICLDKQYLSFDGSFQIEIK